MKQFIKMFLTAIVEASTGGAVAAVAAKTLEQLTAELTAARTAIKSASTDDEMDTATLTMLKIKSAIKALEAKADSEAKLAKVAELRKAEVATIDELINAAHEHAIAKKDDKQAAADKLTALREAHINKALAKFVAPKAVKVAGDGTAKEAGTRGGKSADILAFITPLFEGGSTGAEVRKACKEYGGGSWVNFNDGTANAVIVKYEREHGLK